MADGEPGLRPLARGAGGRRLRRSRLRPAGRKLRAPSDGCGRRLAGEGLRRGRQGLSGAARRRRTACSRSIDDNGDLLVRRIGKAEVERRKLLPLRSRTPSWLDPKTGGPRVKLLRTIRLDPSDTFVFERAAEPGEWAVSGSFVFWDDDPATLRRQGARRVPRRLPRRAVARLVDAGADRRGERRRPRGRGRHAGASNWSRISARRARGRDGRRRGGVRVRGVAVRSSARHADRDASHATRTARSAKRSARCGPKDGPKPLRAFASSRSRARTSRESESRSDRRSADSGTSRNAE